MPKGIVAAKPPDSLEGKAEAVNGAPAGSATLVKCMNSGVRGISEGAAFSAANPACPGATSTRPHAVCR